MVTLLLMTRNIDSTSDVKFPVVPFLLSISILVSMRINNPIERNILLLLLYILFTSSRLLLFEYKKYLHVSSINIYINENKSCRISDRRNIFYVFLFYFYTVKLENLSRIFFQSLKFNTFIYRKLKVKFLTRENIFFFFLTILL